MQIRPSYSLQWKKNCHRKELLQANAAAYYIPNINVMQMSRLHFESIASWKFLSSSILSKRGFVYLSLREIPFYTFTLMYIRTILYTFRINH